MAYLMVANDWQSMPWWMTTVPVVISVLVVFVVPALSSRGASAGQTAVWLTPKWVSEDGTHLTDGTLVRRLARAMVVPGPLLLGDLFPAGILSVLGNLLGIGVMAAMVLVRSSLTHRSLSGWVTGAVFVDSREPIAGGPANQDPAPLQPVDRERLGIIVDGAGHATVRPGRP